MLKRLRTDAQVLWSLVRGQPRTGNHAERLAAFYGPQAEQYDSFRERLLAGRREMLMRLTAELKPGARLVELGCGTGRNLEYMGTGLEMCSVVILVDLCEPLLKVAERRFRGRPQVRCVHADATRFEPESPVDAVYLSYALTMIPDWQATLANAERMLKPGGVIGVVDFHVSAAHAAAGHQQHGPWTRWFWPRWFGHDGVHLNPAHLAWLEEHFDTLSCIESRNPVPYLLGLTVPYYFFVGRKRS
jgi:S-adenosylmethionine-diacylgycerolhomoserine-N-methlytransferase